jgi:hypothetical protein
VAVPHWRSFDGTSPETAARMAVVDVRLANLFEPTAGPFPPSDSAA